ncbi:MAG: SYNERG-CTERM sorting domain-containing protein [Myxococcota bacterium]|nr:SYNERG-CTERM sorting domain-containing protein [Myxococcota bacterium]
MTSQHQPSILLRIVSPAARVALHAAVLAVGVSTIGCALPGDDEPALGIIESEVSVAAYTTSGCSTSVVIGLSKQIAEEIGCMGAGSLVRFTPSANLQITSNAVLPYLHGAAKANLDSVAATRVVQVNSAFRTVAQQYLLYRWYQLGRCGITAAATPGRSNHEGGRALDIQNYSSVISAMGARGWSHNVPGDPVHFEHLSSPDLRGRDVLAFQRLWNRNTTTDKIAEDGAYGPQTEARLRAAPATGFARGATCGTREQAADVVMIEGPDKIAPGTKATYAITLNNAGAADWPASTKLVVTGGGTSPLYDAASWTSPGEIGTLDMDVPAGQQGIVAFEVAAPLVTEETPLFTQLSLASDGASFGTINLAVTVTPNGDEGMSGDSSDEHDEGAQVTGGCNAGGAGGWAALLIPALVLLRRRRR